MSVCNSFPQKNRDRIGLLTKNLPLAWQQSCRKWKGTTPGCFVPSEPPGPRAVPLVVPGLLRLLPGPQWAPWWPPIRRLFAAPSGLPIFRRDPHVGFLWRFLPPPPVAPAPCEAAAPAILTASALWNCSCTSCKFWASVKLGISEIGLWSSAMLPTMLILYVSYYWKVKRALAFS
jgi:hypothetical protein